MEKIFENKKSWLVGLLITVLALSLLSFIFDMIVVSDYATGGDYVVIIIGLLISLCVFSLALVAVLKENKFWMKVLFITYFSYLLFSAVFGIVNYFYYLGTDNASLVFYGLGALLNLISIIVLGVVYLLYLGGIVHEENIVNILVYVRLAVVFINFIIGIVAIANGYMSWSKITRYFTDFILTLIFFIGLKYNNCSCQKTSSTSSNLD